MTVAKAFLNFILMSVSSKLNRCFLEAPLDANFIGEILETGAKCVFLFTCEGSSCCTKGTLQKFPTLKTFYCLASDFYCFYTLSLRESFESHCKMQGVKR